MAVTSTGSRFAGRLLIVLLGFILALGTIACAGAASRGASSPSDASPGPGATGHLQSGDVAGDGAACGTSIRRPVASMVPPPLPIVVVASVVGAPVVSRPATGVVRS